jgi:adenylate cyclase
MNRLLLWLSALPLVLIAAFFQITLDLGERGELESGFLRETIYPIARSVTGALTNVKFRLRGPESANQKIVILAADEESITQYGRWPWHREVYAEIIHRLLEMRVKTIGLDVVFSEPEERIHEQAYELIRKHKPSLMKDFLELESDPQLAQAIAAAKDRLVLGYAYDGACQPRYEKGDYCPLAMQGISEDIHASTGKFAIGQPYPYPKDTLWKTSLKNLYHVIPNIDLFSANARYAGTFNADPDPDGYIRRYGLFSFSEKLILPSLAVKMAELARDDRIQIEFRPDGLIKKAYFKKDPANPIPVTPLGYMDINFKGPTGLHLDKPIPGYEPYHYIPVHRLLSKLEPLEEAELQEILLDSHVLFGATALGIYDMRAFPFDSNTPGVEGHATALDNLIAGTQLRSASAIHMSWLPLTLIVVFGLVFIFLFSSLDAIPSILVFIGFLSVLGWIDIRILFKNHINLSTTFLLIETFLIFVTLLSIRYILEEKKKKFVKEAFSKYLAPQVVELVLEDPSKLQVGGERKEVTILFSDLRGFTNFSENMDPKVLTQFLNEYLSEMTEIIFQHEGTLDKYIGDAIMAFWGAPIDQKDHVERAWRAAVAMKKRLDEIAPDFKKRYGIDVSAGIGINSGLVSVGNMGSKRIFEYTVIGDHVNLASRLESLTRLYGGDILSTEVTRERLSEGVQGQFHTRILDSVIVKGKTKAVDLIQISEVEFDPELIRNFTEAREAFKHREWEVARAKFKLASEIQKARTGSVDPVSEIYLSRCVEFEKAPPPADWDGTIEMHRK